MSLVPANTLMPVTLRPTAMRTPTVAPEISASGDGDAIRARAGAEATGAAAATEVADARVAPATARIAPTCVGVRRGAIVNCLSNRGEGLAALHPPRWPAKAPA